MKIYGGESETKGNALNNMTIGGCPKQYDNMTIEGCPKQADNRGMP